MTVFDTLNPLAHVTPRFTEEQLEEMVQWFDENAKPLLTINDAPEPTNVVTIEQFVSFLELKKYSILNSHDTVVKPEIFFYNNNGIVIRIRIKVNRKKHNKTFFFLFRFHRRSFQYPTYFEIMTEAEKLHAGVTRMLTKDQFIYMLNLWVRESDIRHELELAFQVSLVS